MSSLGRLLFPAGLGFLTVALLVGAFTGMSAIGWALVTLAAFMSFLNAVLITYRKP